MAISTLITTGKAHGPWLMMSPTVEAVLLWVPPNFFAAVDELDPSAVVGGSNNAIGVLGEGNNLVIF